ncbi:MAG: CDP-glycerol glycerophosphotransferase family protein [Staphylococcus equorum]
MKNKYLDDYYNFLQMPIEDDCFLFESYHAESTTGNPYAIFNYLKDHTVKKVWVLRDGALPIPYLTDSLNVSIVTYGSKDYFKYLATAKYLINDTSFLSYFIKRKEQIYVNTWHGTPYKTLGIDVKNMNLFDIRNIKRNFLISDYLIMPNKYTADIIDSAFQIKSLRNNQMIISGNPRVDLNFSTPESIKLKYNIQTNKKIVLYAPTWDESGVDTEFIIENLINKIRDIQKLLGETYTVKLKVHYFVYEKIINSKYHDLLLPNNIDTNELLSIVDRVITDYSSILFDFLPTMKPIYLLLDNYNFYENERGLYLQPNELPVQPSFDFKSLLHDLSLPISVYLHNNKSRINNAITNFCPMDDGLSSKRIVEEILQNKIANRVLTNQNKKILLMIDELTESFIVDSLISYINKQCAYENITIFTRYTSSFSLDTFLKKVHSPVNFIFKFGYTPADSETLDHINYLVDSPITEKYDSKSINFWTNMKNRLFGNISFTEIINFNHDSIDNNYLVELFETSTKKLWVNSDLSSFYDYMGTKKNKNLNTLSKSINQYDEILYADFSLIEKNELFLKNLNG